MADTSEAAEQMALILAQGGSAFLFADDAGVTAAELAGRQNGLAQALFEAAGRGLAAARDHTPAAWRLTEMHDFSGFVFRELPAPVDRRQAERGHMT